MKKNLYFSNLVFILGICFFVLFTIYAIYKLYIISFVDYTEDFYYYKFIFIGIFFTSLFIVGLKLNKNIKLYISIIVVTIGISIYTAEAFLNFLELNKNKELYQDFNIQNYDNRSVSEVINDLNELGLAAFPNIFPRLLLKNDGLILNGEHIYPLGGISNIVTTFVNEAGYYPIINTDEYGFNNPKGLYKKNNVDIMMTGDSFSSGFSVNPEETMSSVLRSFGYNSINIGKGSNGPLFELASIREYASILKPKVVLWQYFKNDFDDLEGELNSSIMRKYLMDDDFTQNLILKQDEIDSLLKAFISNHFSLKINTNNVLFNFIKLKQVRSIINRNNLNSDKNHLNNVFRDILIKSKKNVESWNGKLYFVYIPSFSKYANSIEDINREFVIDLLKKLDIPLIDMQKEVLDLHDDPLSLFPFRRNNHYNADGYKLFAEAIINRLLEDNIIIHLDSQN